MSTNRELFPETLLVQSIGSEVFTTSRKVAEHFGKKHGHVLRSIDLIQAELPYLVPTGILFFRGTYDVEVGFAAKAPSTSNPKLDRKSGVRKAPMYWLSHDGFALLAMSFTGRDAMAWKLKFLAAFREMERQLNARTARESAALFQLRPRWRVIRDNPGLRNNQMTLLTGHKSPSSITANRRRMREVGLA